LIKIIDKEATTDANGLFKVILEVQPGMIGLFGISVDFGKTISYPFEIKTVHLGTGITITEYPDFPYNAKYESMTHSCLVAGFKG
jgi:hypothetical protein